MAFRWALLLFVSTLFASGRADVPSLNDALTANGNLSSFQSLLTTQFPDLLKQLGAADSSNPITLCAPSNDAFTNMQYSVIAPAWANNDSTAIGNILSYHVIPGEHTSQTLDGSFQFLPTLLTDKSVTSVSGGQRVGAVLQGGEPPLIVFVSGFSTRSVVMQEDIAFTGGVIQVVDNFLVPPQPFVDTDESFDPADTNQSITSFLGAVYSLPDMAVANYLNSSQNVTIFVPNNIAMETVNGALTSMTPSALENILAYHIFTSTEPLYSPNFTNGTVLSTASGRNLQFTFVDNSLFVNSARVLTSDLLISNGVMHVIDNVLDPSSTLAAPNPTSATQIPVLPTTLGTFNGSNAPFTTFIPSFTTTADDGDATAASSGDASYSGPSSTSSAGSAPTTTKKSSAAPRYPRTHQEPLLPVPALVAGVFCGALCAF